jgi:hypothetical protein
MTAAEGFWRDRRVLVTGCTGLVGAWTTRALVERGAHVVGLVRDRVHGSELVRSGFVGEIDVVRGRVEDGPLPERAVGEPVVWRLLRGGRAAAAPRRVTDAPGGAGARRRGPRHARAPGRAKPRGMRWRRGSGSW